MSLQIPIQKDIGEYEEKIVGKLSFRTLVCVAGGFGSAILVLFFIMPVGVLFPLMTLRHFGAAILVAALCHFWIGIEVADAAFPVMCASIPFWLAGFWRPFGMRAEKFAPLLANHHLKDQRLLYACPAAPFLEKPEAGKPTRRARRAAKRKGAEGHEPSRQEDI